MYPGKVGIMKKNACMETQTKVVELSPVNLKNLILNRISRNKISPLSRSNKQHVG